MNDERNQIERAMSRQIPAGDLDADTASLREGWRVLNQALEGADRDFDEAAFTARLQSQLLVEPARSAISTHARRHPGWIIAAAILGGCLAASLLFVLALASGQLSKQQVAEPARQKNKAAQPAVAIAKLPGEKSQSISESPPAGSARESDGGSWSWDDPLDSQISVAAAQMQSLQKPALPLDSSISTLNWQLQQMAQDLEEGAL